MNQWLTHLWDNSQMLLLKMLTKQYLFYALSFSPFLIDFISAPVATYIHFLWGIVSLVKQWCFSVKHSGWWAVLFKVMLAYQVNSICYRSFHLYFYLRPTRVDSRISLLFIFILITNGPHVIIITHSHISFFFIKLFPCIHLALAFSIIIN